MCDGEVLAAFKDQLRDAEASRDLYVNIIRRAAEALGRPFEGEGSSWHDIPERIEQLRREHAQLSRRPTITECKDLREQIALLQQRRRLS